jgi:hypothetical protein
MVAKSAALLVVFFQKKPKGTWQKYQAYKPCVLLYKLETSFFIYAKERRYDNSNNHSRNYRDFTHVNQFLFVCRCVYAFL